METMQIRNNTIGKHHHWPVKYKTMTKPQKYSFQVADDNAVAIDVLTERTGISKTKLKDAMAKGAVWLTRAGERRRLRRVTTNLKTGDTLEVFYDENILRAMISPPVLLADEKEFSVWYKPSGLVTQGTDYGDHCALEHLVDVHFSRNRPVFLVHRIDREASGLVLMAHSKRMAATLSELFRDQKVEKQYWIKAMGKVGVAESEGTINISLDDKSAETWYRVENYDEINNVSTVLVQIKTGRRHQIRRHFDQLGHPVLGDPQYGIGNKNRSGMKLTAWWVRFRHPVTGKEYSYDLSRLHPEALAEYTQTQSND